MDTKGVISTIEASPYPDKLSLRSDHFDTTKAEYLIFLLKDRDRWIRYAAIMALGDIGNPAAVSHLISLLKDPDQNIRFASAESLGKIGDRRAIEPLWETFETDNQYVKVAAENALSFLTFHSPGLTRISEISQDFVF